MKKGRKENGRRCSSREEQNKEKKKAHWKSNQIYIAYEINQPDVLSVGIKKNPNHHLQPSGNKCDSLNRVKPSQFASIC